MKRRWIFSLLTASLVAGMVGTSYADVKVSGGELRLRGVMVDNGDSNSTDAPGISNGGFWEQRTRLNVDATADDAKVFLQVQDSRKWGSEGTTTDTADNVNGGIDLSQGYIEFGKLFDKPLSVRVGRQAMAYGEHRLVGALEWSNNARRFDAIKFTYKHDAADIDVWTAKVSDANQAYGNDNNLNGIYASLKMVPKNAVDVYLLQKLNGTSDMNIYTIGGRVKGAVENVNIDYNAEVAIQSGDFNANSSQSASAYAIRAGYTIPTMKGLRIGVEYDAATGQDASATATDDNEAFEDLYPTGHYLYGYTDDVIWSNIKALSVNASLKPMDKMTLAVEYWNYKADQEDSSGNDDRGTEINIKANHELSKNINCEAAYVIRDNGNFDNNGATAGSGVATYGGFGNITADESSTFGYLMINVKFM